MFHGSEKKIYHIKGIGGHYFDEAYLVLRDGCTEEPRSKNLAEEAEKIIRDATAGMRRSRLLRHRAKNVMLFVLGALSSSAVIGAVAFLVLA